MSSYVSSAFMIEERRLEGIVSKCTEDLNVALQHVIEQQNLINRKKEEQNIKEQSYVNSQTYSARQYNKQLLQNEEDIARRKEYLKKVLHNTQLELNIFQNQYVDMEEAIQRQEQLLFRLENNMGNLEELEQSIVVHINKIKSEFKTITMENEEKFDYKMGENIKKQRKKGVSLKYDFSNSSQRIIKKTPIDDFSYKLETALQSPYSNYFPSLVLLKKEFDSQQEYAKSAFAVKNMKKLEELLIKLETIEKRKKYDGDKREKIILQYKAICELMDIEIDEELINDERSTQMIIQLSDTLFKKYQECKKHTYISNAISKIMERHNIEFQDSILSSRGNIMRFSMDNASVDISGTENNHLIMEVTGEYNGESPTLNERRKSVASAQYLCSLLKTIENELKEEYGIIFNEVFSESPSEETIVMKKTNKEIENKKYIERKQQLLNII